MAWGGEGPHCSRGGSQARTPRRLPCRSEGPANFQGRATGGESSKFFVGEQKKKEGDLTEKEINSGNFGLTDLRGGVFGDQAWRATNATEVQSRREGG